MGPTRSLAAPGRLPDVVVQTYWAGPSSDSEPPDPEPTLAGAIRELALRIFTDLALGREVRWQASRHFVAGLDYVRACLRSPQDRKVNLRHAEVCFLAALSEDEDFPHAYYNLGIVYNELYSREGWPH